MVSDQRRSMGCCPALAPRNPDPGDPAAKDDGTRSPRIERRPDPTLPALMYVGQCSDDSTGAEVTSSVSTPWQSLGCRKVIRDPMEPRRDHPGVVEDQKVAAFQPVAEPRHRRVVQARRPRDQQPRSRPRPRRPERDQLFGQMVVELVEPHGARYRRATDRRQPALSPCPAAAAGHVVGTREPDRRRP